MCAVQWSRVFAGGWSPVSDHGKLGFNSKPVLESLVDNVALKQVLLRIYNFALCHCNSSNVPFSHLLPHHRCCIVLAMEVSLNKTSLSLTCVPEVFFSIQAMLQLSDVKLASHLQGEYTHFYDAGIVPSYTRLSTQITILSVSFHARQVTQQDVGVQPTRRPRYLTL